MKKLIFILVIGWAQMVLASFESQLLTLEKSKDDLGIRILLREYFKRPIQYKEWRLARTVLGRRPGAGFDLVMAWDRHPSIKKYDTRTVKTIQALEKADQMMISKNFDGAFKLYQNVAKYFRAQSKGGVKKSNIQFKPILFYFNTVPNKSPVFHVGRSVVCAME